MSDTPKNGGEDDLDALEALESEAKEFNKVCTCLSFEYAGNSH